MGSLLLGILIFLLLSAFFSGSEIAFISANKLNVELRKEHASRRAHIVTNFFDNPKRFLSTMLVGNNIALVVFTSLMTQLIHPFTSGLFGEDLGALLVDTLIITIVVLLFGEYLPKTIFRLFSDKALYLLAYPLSFFKSILAAPTWLTNVISDGMLRFMFRTPAVDSVEAFTRADLQHFIEDNVTEHDDDIDKDIFTNALQLDQIKVRSCLVPRTEIVYVDINASIDDLLQAFQESRMSRIIVIDDDIEQVKGYVHHQQLLSDPVTIEEIILEIAFIPEAMNIRDLMLQFIKDNTNIACVVDEFGGIAGVITLEDMLEEIFGEIEDEHDNEAHEDYQISEHEYSFPGRLEVDYLNEKYNDLNLPEGDYHTLSGYIVMTSEQIPNKGDELRLGDYRFILTEVSDTKIERVTVVYDPVNAESSTADEE